MELITVCGLCGTRTARDLEVFENVKIRAICPNCVPADLYPASSPLWDDDNWISAAMTDHTIEIVWFVSNGNSVGEHSDYYPLNFTSSGAAHYWADQQGLNHFTVWAYDASGDIITA